MKTPKTGGRYKRAADGTILRVDRAAAATPAAEKAPQPAPTEAAPAAQEGSVNSQEDE